MTSVNESKRKEFQSSITDTRDHVINVRGYPLKDIIKKLTFSETVFLTIRGELPTKEQARVMDAVLCGIVDHGLYAPTILAARVVASASPSSIMPAIASGMLTVGQITVSPQDTAELIKRAFEIKEEKGLSKKESAAKIVEEYRMNRIRLPGLGHPLHPTGDPRAIALKEVAVEQEVWGERGEMYEQVHKAFVVTTGKEFPINIDGMMGCVLSELGFSPKEMAGIAAISFMPGIIAHAVEESESIKLRIAECEYTGLEERKLP